MRGFGDAVTRLRGSWRAGMGGRKFAGMRGYGDARGGAFARLRGCGGVGVKCIIHVGYVFGARCMVRGGEPILNKLLLTLN